MRVFKRIVFVGDIHGCYDDFMELLKELGFSQKDLLIATGDLVDRGPSSKEVLEFFMENGNTMSVMGNHEWKHVRGILGRNQCVTKIQMGDFYEEALGYMRTLPLYVETDGFVVFHYSTLPWLPVSQVAKEHPNLLTGSGSVNKKRYPLYRYFPDGKWWKAYGGEKIVVFGHNSVFEDGKRIYRVADRVYNLDGGCAGRGEIVALVYPDMELVVKRCDCDAERVRKNFVSVHRKRVFHISTWREVEEAIEDEDYPEWFREKLKLFMEHAIRCSEILGEDFKYPDKYFRRFPPKVFAEMMRSCAVPWKEWDFEEWLFESPNGEEKAC